MITIKDSSADYGIRFPQDIKELKIEELQACVNNIVIPKHYAIIALAFKTTPFATAMALNNKNAEAVSVTPILVRMDEEDTNSHPFNEGDKAIVVRTEIERAIHINVNTSITSDNFALYLQTFKNTYMSIIRNSHEAARENIILVEFKLLPITSVSATKSLNAKDIDPFVVTD